MNTLTKSTLALAMASGAMAFGTTHGKNGGIQNPAVEASSISPSAPNIIQQTLDEVRGFQDTMPVVTDVSEEMASKVQKLLKHTMNQCLSRNEKVDQKAYRAEKATWPKDIQQRVYACCRIDTLEEGPYFQIEVDDKGFKTFDGMMFFQQELTCPRPLPKVSPVPKKKEQSTLDIDINHLG